jgi:hypothetical protein
VRIAFPKLLLHLLRDILPYVSTFYDCLRPSMECGVRWQLPLQSFRGMQSGRERGICRLPFFFCAPASSPSSSLTMSLSTAVRASIKSFRCRSRTESSGASSSSFRSRRNMSKGGKVQKSARPQVGVCACVCCVVCCGVVSCSPHCNRWLGHLTNQVFTKQPDGFVSIPESPGGGMHWVHEGGCEQWRHPRSVAVGLLHCI